MRQPRTLIGATPVWTSSLDGKIGAGEMFRAYLSAGTHTITDSDGNSDAVTIALTMTLQPSHPSACESCQCACREPSTTH